MKPRALLLVVLLLSVAAVARERAWHTGKLIKLTIQSVEGDTYITSTRDYFGNVRSNAVTDRAVNYYATVSDDSYEYLAGRQLDQNDRMPLLTENAPIRFVIEKDILILKDDRGKEFKMRLAKRTAKN